MKTFTIILSSKIYTWRIFDVNQDFWWLLSCIHLNVCRFLHFQIWLPYKNLFISQWDHFITIILLQIILINCNIIIFICQWNLSIIKVKNSLYGDFDWNNFKVTVTVARVRPPRTTLLSPLTNPIQSNP